MSEVRVPAVRFKQKSNSLYLFYLPADQLVKLVKSDPRISTNPIGIQRLLSRTRLKSIADYISRPETCLPNNIIISFSEQVRFEDTSSDGMGVLIFPNDEGHFGNILDGQHRLYGITHDDSSARDLPMPVTGLMLHDAKSAGRIFADINQLQKPVSRLLLVSLQRELGDLVNAKDNAAAIAEQLNEDTDSPLHTQIRMFQDEKDYWLSYEQVVNSLSPLFEKGQRLSFLPADIALDRIKNYLHAIAETFPTAWGDNKEYRLTSAAGFDIVMGIFERAHQRARDIKSSNGPTKEDFVSAIEPIKFTDWSANTFKDSGFTSSAGRKVLLRQLLDELPPE